MGQQVLVVLEPLEDEGGNAELLTVGRRLAAALGGSVTALIASSETPAGNVAGLAEGVAVVVDPSLATRAPDAVLEAVHVAVAQFRPTVVLMAHNTCGKEVAPRLAARERTALVTDCVDLRIDAATQALVGVRPCFSGKALSDWALSGPGPKIATLRRQSVTAEPAPSLHGTVTNLSLPDAPQVRTAVLERVVPPPGQVRLEDAEIVVSVGRGVGTREDFESYIVNGLARELGAACGGSRGAVDLGIVPPELQIGLTGRVVSPKMYIAVGLSGAPQHMAGCGGARNIIAINTDPQAPIFAYAHYGVVGDFRKVVPALTTRLREILAVSA